MQKCLHSCWGIPKSVIDLSVASVILQIINHNSIYSESICILIDKERAHYLEGSSRDDTPTPTGRNNSLSLDTTEHCSR